jgi:hypothetical protein
MTIFVIIYMYIETMGFVDFLNEKLLNIVELVKRIDIE